MRNRSVSVVPPRIQGLSTVRVLIVDDQTLFAEGVRSALQDHGVEVVGIAATGRAAVEAARTERPDTILMDLGLPDMDGISAGEAILAEQPTVKVVALTGLEEPGTIRRAIESGFHGYVLKHTSLEELIGSILAASEWHVVIPRQMAWTLVSGNQDGGQEQGILPDAGPSDQADEYVRGQQVTSRERQILTMLAAGMSNADIAARLFLSRNTVRTHIHNVLKKLHVHSRLEAVAFAVRNGIIHQETEARRA